jgi:hypothetical protein
MSRTLAALTLAFGLFALTAPVSPVSADYCTTSYLGSTAYTYCSDGSSAISTSVGSTTYTSVYRPDDYPDMSPSSSRPCTFTRIGRSVYRNCD